MWAPFVRLWVRRRKSVLCDNFRLVMLMETVQVQEDEVSPY